MYAIVQTNTEALWVCKKWNGQLFYLSFDSGWTDIRNLWPFAPDTLTKQKFDKTAMEIIEGLIEIPPAPLSELILFCLAI